jgi:tRNA (guanosine-2'-O-)-methyltransferase
LKYDVKAAAMRRVSADTGDIFKPKGQLKREITLAMARPADVIRILGEHLSNDRKARINQVIEHRIRRQTVAIEGLIDPHNTAAVIRTAEAFGLQTVHIIEGATRFVSSRKVTQGTHKWIDFAVWKSPKRFAETVREEGKQILVADAGAGQSLFDLDPAVSSALVFGNEHLGISPAMRELSDGAFSIPMTGFAESINVSVAAAITISALAHRCSGDLTDREKKILKARFYLRAVRAGYDIVKLGIDEGRL